MAFSQLPGNLCKWPLSNIISHIKAQSQWNIEMCRNLQSQFLKHFLQYSNFDANKVDIMGSFGFRSVVEQTTLVFVLYWQWNLKPLNNLQCQSQFWCMAPSFWSISCQGVILMPARIGTFFFKNDNTRCHCDSAFAWLIVSLKGNSHKFQDILTCPSWAEIWQSCLLFPKMANFLAPPLCTHEMLMHRMCDQ